MSDVRLTPEEVEALALARSVLSHDAETFRFNEPGDEVVGKLVQRGLGETEHSHNYPVLTIESAVDGRWLAVHAFHQVLWDEVEKQDPQPGDVVGIRYLGRHDGGRGASGYERFRLAVVRPRKPGVGDPAVTGSASNESDAAALSAAAMSPPGEPVHQGPAGSGAGPAETSPSLGEPARSAPAGPSDDPIMRGERRTSLWAQVVEGCQATGLVPSAAINTACGSRHTTTSAAAAATVEELERTLGWLANRRP